MCIYSTHLLYGGCITAVTDVALTHYQGYSKRFLILLFVYPLYILLINYFYFLYCIIYSMLIENYKIDSVILYG